MARTAWVQGVQALNAWGLAVGAVSLSTAHEDDLQLGVGVRCRVNCVLTLYPITIHEGQDLPEQPGWR